jgi:AcrR family transcriptional regulator
VADAREDRRVRRTRRLLREALLGLVAEKGYDRVTVQDVIDRADLSRATFYAHFRDKDDLLLSGLDELEEALRGTMAAYEAGRLATGEAQVSFGAVLEHVAAHRWLYRGLVGSRAAVVFQRQVRRRLTSLVRQHFQQMVESRRSSPPVPLEAAAEFAVGALLGVVWWWLEQDAPLPPERVAWLLELLTTPALETALGLRPPSPTIPSR